MDNDQAIVRPAKGNGGIGIIIDAFNSDKPYEDFLNNNWLEMRWSIGVMPNRIIPKFVNI